MTFGNKEKVFSRRWCISYLMIIIGAFILSAGYVLFIAPYKIIPGGVYGIGIILYHIFGIPVGLTGLALNIPLLIIGIKVLGPRFGVKTVVGFILASAFIDGITLLWGMEPLVENDVLLSSIFGGVLIGLGLGLIFKARATSGGTSIVAMIISKYTRIPLGQSLMIADAIIVLLGLAVFQDWAIPLYSWLTIYITGKVIDGVIEGMSFEKTVFIISEKHKEISEKILFDLDRGGTMLEGKGMYKGEDKKILFVNVTRRELPILQDYIHQVDPKAFLTVIDASEIMGEGFKRLEKTDI